jgi:hypothetical protein
MSDWMLCARGPSHLSRRHVAALHHAPIDTLEHIGGGGVRCTLAEIF